MTYLKQIDEIIKQEVDKKVKGVLEKFIPVICRRYEGTFIEKQLWIELGQVDQLFKEIGNKKIYKKKETPKCKGKRRDGTPCQRPVKKGHYCCNHQDQDSHTIIVSGPSTPSVVPHHNHNVFSMPYKEDCPACIAKKKLSLHTTDLPSPSGPSLCCS